MTFALCVSDDPTCHSAPPAGDSGARSRTNKEPHPLKKKTNKKTTKGSKFRFLLGINSERSLNSSQC